MASAVPYDPEGFGAETNPFAQDDNHVESTPTIVPSSAVESSPTQETESATQSLPVSAPASASETVPASQHAQTPRPVKKYKLALKVTALERQGKKDPIIRFDAYTTLPRFRTTTFKDIRRTHHEFMKFGSHLNNANPECFVPPVPPSVTSAGAGTEEDEIKVKRKIQLWLDRVSANPILARDEEFVNFIESDFGYSPLNKRKPPATGMTRKALKQLQPPHDEVTELAEFRPIIKQLYLASQDTNAKLEKVSKSRRALGLALIDFGGKIAQYTTVDNENLGMTHMWRKLSKVFTAIGDLEAIKATSEAVSLGDGLNLIAQDGYVAKEAMTNRHLLMRELVKAQANTKSKHQTAVKLKGSTNINPAKVDEAIAILEDATNAEEQLTNKVRRVTENMLIEKPILKERLEGDIRSYIAEYVVRIIESERRALSAWESVRADVRAADANGGLSRLGRESYPSRRGVPLAQSQTVKGDSWSGDRTVRAQDFNDSPSSFSDNAGKKDTEESGKGELDVTEEATLVDARNAASLLAGSTF
jgi:hypothetical protein